MLLLPIRLVLQEAPVLTPASVKQLKPTDVGLLRVENRQTLGREGGRRQRGRIQLSTKVSHEQKL